MYFVGSDEAPTPISEPYTLPLGELSLSHQIPSQWYTDVSACTGTYGYIEVHTGTHRYTHVHRYRYTQVHTTTWIAFTLTSDTFTDDLSGFDNIMAIVMMAMFMVLEILVITSINKYSL